MQITAMVVQAVVRLAFVLLAVRAVWRWRQDRTVATGAVGAALGLLAVVLAGGWVAREVGLDGWWLDLVLAVSFAGSGYAVQVHQASVVAVARRVRVMAGVALTFGVVAYATAAALAGHGAASTGQMLAPYVLLGTYLLVVTDPAVRVWRLAGQVPVIRRIRLRLLSGAYASIAVVLLVTMAVNGRHQTNPITALVASLIGLGLVPVLYLAVDPPAWARRWWLQRHARHEAMAALPVAAWYIDLDDGQQELWWSPTLRDLLGVGHDEPASWEGFFARVHPDDRAWLAARSTGAFRVPSPDGVDFRIVRPDGQVRHVHGRARVLPDPSGEVSGVFGTIQDITVHEQARLQTQRALEQEQAATARLRELDQMKSDILSAVSHELRTPLTVVAGMGRILDQQYDDLAPEDRHLVIQRLLANTDRLALMFDDLLDLNRSIRGRLELTTVTTDIAALIRKRVEATPASDHPLRVEAPDRLDASVDPRRFERIVDNLIGNARLHTPAGTPIVVRLRRERTTAHLEVADQGPGIPDELKRVVLEPFERGPGPHPQGAGLGLAIVARFTHAHDGQVWIENTPMGGGTTVHIRIPLGHQPRPALAARSSDLSPPAFVQPVPTRAHTASVGTSQPPGDRTQPLGRG